MGSGPSGHERRAMLTPRAIALLALVLALGLLVWRGNALLVTPDETWEPASLTEASLLGVIEPVAGAGNVRLTISKGVRQGRKVLILLSEEAAGTSGAVERIARIAADIDPDRGDNLTIETATFAAKAAGPLSPAEWGELGAYGLLCALLAWLGLMPAASASQQQTESRYQAAREVTEPVLQPERGQAPQRIAAPSGDAADLARTNPGKAADVLRSWMKQDGTAA